MKKMFFLGAILLLITSIILLAIRVNTVNRECSDYSNSNWIVAENSHAENLKKKKIVFYTLQMPEIKSEVEGWKIIRKKIIVDDFRKKRSGKNSATGISHYIYCNNCINLWFACTLLLKDEVAVVKEMVRYLEKYDTDGQYYTNTLSALKTLNKSKDLVIGAAGDYKMEFGYLLK